MLDLAVLLCRLLIYTPDHPFIRAALAAVTATTLEHFEQRRWESVRDVAQLERLS